MGALSVLVPQISLQSLPVVVSSIGIPRLKTKGKPLLKNSISTIIILFGLLAQYIISTSQAPDVFPEPLHSVANSNGLFIPSTPPYFLIVSKNVPSESRSSGSPSDSSSTPGGDGLDEHPPNDNVEDDDFNLGDHGEAGHGNDDEDENAPSPPPHHETNDNEEVVNEARSSNYKGKNSKDSSGSPPPPPPPPASSSSAGEDDNYNPNRSWLLFLKFLGSLLALLAMIIGSTKFTNSRNRSIPRELDEFHPSTTNITLESEPVPLEVIVISKSDSNSFLDSLELDSFPNNDSDNKFWEADVIPESKEPTNPLDYNDSTFSGLAFVPNPQASKHFQSASKRSVLPYLLGVASFFVAIGLLVYAYLVNNWHIRFNPPIVKETDNDVEKNEQDVKRPDAPAPLASLQRLSIVPNTQTIQIAAMASSEEYPIFSLDTTHAVQGLETNKAGESDVKDKPDVEVSASRHELNVADFSDLSNDDGEKFVYFPALDVVVPKPIPNDRAINDATEANSGKQSTCFEPVSEQSDLQRTSTSTIAPLSPDSVLTSPSYAAPTAAISLATSVIRLKALDIDNEYQADAIENQNTDSQNDKGFIYSQDKLDTAGPIDDIDHYDIFVYSAKPQAVEEDITVDKGLQSSMWAEPKAPKVSNGKEEDSTVDMGVQSSMWAEPQAPKASNRRKRDVRSSRRAVPPPSAATTSTTSSSTTDMNRVSKKKSSKNGSAASIWAKSDKEDIWPEEEFGTKLGLGASMWATVKDEDNVVDPDERKKLEKSGLKLFEGERTEERHQPKKSCQEISLRTGYRPDISSLGSSRWAHQVPSPISPKSEMKVRHRRLSDPGLNQATYEDQAIGNSDEEDSKSETKLELMVQAWEKNIERSLECEELEGQPPSIPIPIPVYIPSNGRTRKPARTPRPMTYSEFKPGGFVPRSVNPPI